MIGFGSFFRLGGGGWGQAVGAATAAHLGAAASADAVTAAAAADTADSGLGGNGWLLRHIQVQQQLLLELLLLLQYLTRGDG